MADILSISISGDRISAAVVSKSRAEVAFYASSPVRPVVPAELPDHLLQVIKDMEIPANDYQTIISIDEEVFTLVPDVYFDPGNPRIYFELISGSVPENQAWDPVKSIGAFLLYPINRAITERLSAQFPGVKIIHPASAIIESAILCSKNATEPRVFVHCGHRHCTLVVTEGRTLRLAINQHAETPEDVVYFTLHTYDQLKLNATTIACILSGPQSNVESVSAVLNKYIARITQREIGEVMQISTPQEHKGADFLTIAQILMLG